mgnify:FL=1|tara:strand:- start:12 stop:428 length:417 start_codon:yes stop_codon:yes gene_type:complete
MASLFCPECGTKNMYTLKKPNFCQGCGETFGAFGMSAPKNNFVNQSSSREVATPNNGGESVPNISKLQYEVDIPKDNVQSFETLVSNPLNPEELSYSAGNIKKQKRRKRMTKEEFLKQSQAECSSSRGRYKDIGGGGE